MLTSIGFSLLRAVHRHLDRNGEIFGLSNTVVIPAHAGTLMRWLFFAAGSVLPRLATEGLLLFP
jgi:hypothetical protein